MKGTITYLNFAGNCREALTFYGRCLESEPNFTPFAAAPPEVSAMAKDTPDRILHCELALGPAVPMVSVTLPDRPVPHGNHFAICLDCESHTVMDKRFWSLCFNGSIAI